MLLVIFAIEIRHACPLVLTPRTDAKRGRVFCAQQLLDILEEPGPPLVAGSDVISMISALGNIQPQSGERMQPMARAMGRVQE